MATTKLSGKIVGEQAPGSTVAKAETHAPRTAGQNAVKIDITDFENLTLNLSNWQAVEAEITAAMQRLTPRQAAAEKLLAVDPPESERRQAEGALFKIREESCELGDRLARAQLQIKTIQGRLGPMEREVKKQKHIRSLAATLRSS